MIGLDPEAAQEMARLQKEIEDLAEQQKEAQAKATDLLLREAAGETGLARAIHDLKQSKMVLATEIQHRKVRINRLLLGS